MATLQQLGTVRLRLRLGGNDYQETLHAVQGDTGRVLEFDVLDGDGTVVTDLPGVVPVLYVRRPDGSAVGSAQGTIAGGVISIPVPSSLLAYAGYAKAQIQLVDSANQHKLHDHLYLLQIEESLEAGASPGENLWFSLAELTEAITTVHELEATYSTDVQAVGARLDSTDAQLNNMTQDFTQHELDYVAHKEEYAQLNIGNRLTNLEEAKIKKYGVRRVLGATTPVLERLGDAVGKVANADTDLTKHNVVQNDFDKIYPWSHMRKCIIDSTGRITYEGEAGYTTAIGDWMVEIPEFYWKKTNDGVNLEEWISEFPVGGYIKSNKFYIARFKTSEQDDAHVSKPNSFPKVTLSRAGFRTKAMEKGAGWQLEDLLGNYILNLLYRVEFAHLNSQEILGNGVVFVRYTEDDLVQVAENATNRVVLLNANANNYNVGEAISIGKTAGGQYRTILAINDLGNGTKELVFDGTPINVLSTYKVYMAGQVSGKTLGLLSSSGTAIGMEDRSSITYRGIEDIFGNVWEWIDGTLINDHQAFICLEPKNYGDTITEHFIPLSYKNATGSGYAGELGFDSNFPFAEFTTDITGGSTTKYCDYYYQNTGLRAALVGGAFFYGVATGLRCWNLNFSPGLAVVHVGSRLLHYPFF